jgi:hypothetical protein
VISSLSFSRMRCVGLGQARFRECAAQAGMTFSIFSARQCSMPMPCRPLPRACCGKGLHQIAWNPSQPEPEHNRRLRTRRYHVGCVLVVEDDPWIQWMIADDLVDRGYQVVTAQDGIEALERIADVRPT